MLVDGVGVCEVLRSRAPSKICRTDPSCSVSHGWLLLNRGSDLGALGTIFELLSGRALRFWKLTCPLQPFHS